MKLQPIQNVEGFERDAETGAILSTDQAALQAYRREKRYRNKLVNDVEELKADFSEIKSMLGQLLCETRSKK